MGWIGDEIHYDCIHFRGDKPCKFRLNCPYCLHYHPMGFRVLIIKLGAMGDVLRTTSLLPSLAQELGKKHNTTHVTWIVDAPSAPLLESNPYIHRIWTVDIETLIRVGVERFDLALCLDKEPRAIGLMAQCQAAKKRGFTMGEEGSLHPIDDASDDAVLMGISDMYKFRRNEKSYQQIVHEMVKLPSASELYVLRFTDDEWTAADRQLAELGATKRPLIGLNTGAGKVFPGKRWRAANFAELGKRLHAATGGTVVLLGGPEEVERNQWIADQLSGSVVELGTDNPLRHFAAMVGRLDLLVTGDTMALHVGLASKVKTVALFGPTPPQEVDMGTWGEKLWREPFGPGIMGQADEESSVIQDITVDEVEAACLRQLGK
ncbi:MAG: glycosyltransferase family 9 protein [Candidatus Lernaella stagnicola]|nr:glycosyltransferase family 9 protein [Candidatus Lernaella stagnicola]